ncbi:MAG: nickel pincer cofactor biosynthesis protein LarC [candidate division Zixibacteria bacterium]|nr:nickel pincer cofactor biosynthesis protein LarC [candidate division Zixibacteria bacterium]
MKTLYFDCFSGISGDMILGALVDVGLDVNYLENELAELNLADFKLNVRKVLKKGITGTKVDVEVKGEQSARHLKDIIELIEASALKADVKNISKKIFMNLAVAEARVHNTDVEKVHFHEVGAVDSIVDIVGTVIGLKELGIEAVYASRVPTGSGYADSQHGRIPVPAPATVELLKDVPVFSPGIEAELTTPTGAAVLKSLAAGFGRMPSMTVEKVGYGAGTRDFDQLPNLLRIFIGEVKQGSYENDEVVLIETNLDDMNPEFFDYVSERLFEEGAVDVFITPIIMKKSRPGSILNVLCNGDRVEPLLTVLFSETTTLGVRMHHVERKKLTRAVVPVDTKYGPVKVKVGRAPGGERQIKSITPEYEDCKRIAAEKKIPLKNVYDEIKRAAARKLLEGDF